MGKGVDLDVDMGIRMEMWEMADGFEIPTELYMKDKPKARGVFCC